MTPDREQLAKWTATITRAVFGDRIGIAIFLVGLLFLTLTWRIGFFINDNYTIANAYIAISNGHFDVRTIQYGPASGNTPGMHLVGDDLYGRNYGQLITALPFLWTIKSLAVVTDIRIALLALWSLALLGLLVLVGAEIDRPDECRLLGSLAALGAFFANLWFATDLEALWYPMLALQLATIVAAALTGVVTYRLLTEMHDRRVGVGVGVATVIASPVAFWAAIPKRHALSALLVLVTLYTFYRSRTRRDPLATRSHAVAYASTVALAWMHAAEGAILFGALLVVDLATAPLTQWPRRRFAYVGSVFLAALTPMFLTNYAISGNPLEPPRMLPGYDGTPPVEQLVGETQRSTEGGSSTSTTEGGSSTSTTEGGSSTSTTEGGSGDGVDAGIWSPFTTIVALFTTALSRADLVQNQIMNGLAAVTDLERLYHVFIRSGWLGQTSIRNNSQTITLTVLESLPLAGALFILPATAATHLRHKAEWTRHLSPERATDTLAVAIAAAFTLIYLPVLPLYAQITPRYLLPLFPLALYGVARLPAVRRALRERLLIWTYGAGVFIGGQLLLGWIALSINGLGEAVQLHAVINLALAALLVGWAGAEHVLERDFPRTGACILALCAAAGTLFVLFARIEYFEVGEGPVLPLVRLLAQRLELLH